jgi:hypothetical protein
MKNGVLMGIGMLWAISLTCSEAVNLKNNFGTPHQFDRLPDIRHEFDRAGKLLNQAGQSIFQF